MRKPSDAPFLRAAFSMRRRSSSAFISSSDIAFSFSLAKFYHAVVAVHKSNRNEALEASQGQSRQPDRVQMWSAQKFKTRCPYRWATALAERQIRPAWSSSDPELRSISAILN